MDLKNWNMYYNKDKDGEIRANLVYTPLVSPDKKTLCMDFNRYPEYHQWPEENALWTEELLTERFNREVKFNSLASSFIATIPIVDIDKKNRRIFLDWYGDDFYMQGFNNGGYDNVLPNWKEQWIDSIRIMQKNNVFKISLHPNSWVVKDQKLIPFNWFFTYELNEPALTIRSLLIQISPSRQEKLEEILSQSGIDIDTKYNVDFLQKIAFYSFRSNYPKDLIDEILR
jgi:hypothetical protein